VQTSASDPRLFARQGDPIFADRLASVHLAHVIQTDTVPVAMNAAARFFLLGLLGHR
jgi:hypothetical protein